jgi:archaellum component FlaC
MAEIIDLNINIGANTTDFEGSLIKAQNLLKQFEAALKKATNVGEINYLNNQIKNLNGTITSLNQKMNTIGRPTSDATNALSNLSRVAQDAPYGFIGIANNLNPLLESFQRLSKESGSSTQALKSMAAGLVGPAGIGLALGVVSSLAITYSDEISAFFKGPTDKLKTFREELNKLNQDIYKIVGEAQSNRTVGLNLVNIIAGGDTKSQQEALKRLKSLYSENKAIKDATIETDKAYLIHLINVAAIQEDAAGKEKNTQQVLSAAYAERAKLLEEQKNQIGKLKPIVIESAGIGTFGGQVISVESQKAAIEKRNKPLLDSLNSIIVTAKSKNLELVTTLTDIETPDPNNSPVVNYAREENKALTLELAKMKALREKFNKLDLTPILDIFNPNAVKEEDKRKSYFEKRAKENLEESNKSGLGDFLEKDSKKRIAAYKREDKELEDLQKSYENFANSVANFGGNIVQTLFQPLQEGETVLDNLSKLFKQLAIDIAAAAIQAVIFEAIMATLDIASGGGATAGKAGGSFIRKIFGFADGGIVTGPTLGMIGEGSESEAILPLSKLGNVMQSSFNAGSMSGYSGGQGGGVAVLRGQDLLIALNRTQRASALKGQNISLA